MSDSENKIQHPAGVFRRFAAMTYDALLLFATLLVAMGIAKAITGAEMVPRLLGQAIVLLVIFGFFAFFWKRGGKTLGMQTWRLHLESNDGSDVTFKHCALRIVGATLSFATGGLGYFWLWFDKQNRALPDILSNTMVFHKPKDKKKKADKKVG